MKFDVKDLQTVPFKNLFRGFAPNPGVYRFCFQEANKKRHQMASLPANLMPRSGRSPAFPYPEHKQSTFYCVPIQKNYTFRLKGVHFRCPKKWGRLSEN